LPRGARCAGRRARGLVAVAARGGRHAGGPRTRTSRRAHGADRRRRGGAQALVAAAYVPAAAMRGACAGRARRPACLEVVAGGGRGARGAVGERAHARARGAPPPKRLRPAAAEAAYAACCGWSAARRCPRTGRWTRVRSTADAGQERRRCDVPAWQVGRAGRRGRTKHGAEGARRRTTCRPACPTSASCRSPPHSRCRRACPTSARWTCLRHRRGQSPGERRGAGRRRRTSPRRSSNTWASRRPPSRSSSSTVVSPTVMATPVNSRFAGLAEGHERQAERGKGGGAGGHLTLPRIVPPRETFRPDEVRRRAAGSQRRHEREGALAARVRQPSWAASGRWCTRHPGSTPSARRWG
jgi:hypothetical protein